MFDRQSESYRKTVLPENIKKISIEAGSTDLWYKYTGREGLTIGINQFGASAPAEILFRELKLDGIPLIVSRTGWSSEFGYELFLRDGSKGDDLYEKIMEAGKDFGIKPGHTSSIRRIEGGMLSYHADADISTNPFELGLDRLVNLDTNIDFIGKKSLQKIKNEGVKRLQVGLEIKCEKLAGPNTTFWPLKVKNKKVGKITSAIYSPRLKKNIALAMIDIEYSNIGVEIDVSIDDQNFKCEVIEKPFFDPKKKITSKLL